MSTHARHLRLVKDPAGRPAPSDLDAEAAILSYAMAIGVIDDVADIVVPEDFFSPTNAIIARVCWDLAARDVALDPVTVMAEIRARGLEQRVAAKELAELIDATPCVENATDHAHIVATAARCRKLIATCQRVAAEGYGDVGERNGWIQDSAREIALLADAATGDTSVTAGDSVSIAMGRVYDAMENRGKLLGLSTGLLELDDKTAGLNPRDLIIVTAKTGGGKTALSGQLAVEVAKQGRGALFFSLEMPHEELTTRIACAEARVNWHAIRRGHQNEHDYADLISAAEMIRQLPLRIDRDRDMTIREICGRSRRRVKEFEESGTPLGAIFIDYVQLVSGREEVPPNASRERELQKVARMLVQLAEELELPVIADAQLNAEGEIRECKAIGFEATSWWDLKVDKDTEPPHPTVIDLKKQRHAPFPNTATCWFHPAFVLFSDEEYLGP